MRTRSFEFGVAVIMLGFLRSRSRRQKAVVFLIIDLALVPVAMLFSFLVQSLAAPAYES